MSVLVHQPAFMPEERAVCSSCPAHHRKRQALVSLASFLSQVLSHRWWSWEPWMFPVCSGRKAQVVFKQTWVQILSQPHIYLISWSLHFNSCKTAIISPMGGFLRGLHEAGTGLIHKRLSLNVRVFISLSLSIQSLISTPSNVSESHSLVLWNGFKFGVVKNQAGSQGFWALVPALFFLWDLGRVISHLQASVSSTVKWRICTGCD